MRPQCVHKAPTKRQQSHLGAKAECRMKNAEPWPRAGLGLLLSAILHSTFCILHSRRGGPVLRRASARPFAIGCCGGIQCSSTAAIAEAILRLRVLSAFAAGDHPRRAGGQGRVRAAADGRRQVALLPVAGDGAGGVDGRRVTADRLDEGPGGCVAGQRRAGHLPQFLTGGRRIAGTAARAAYRAVPAALRGAGAADALGVSVRFAAVGGEPVGR